MTLYSVNTKLHEGLYLQYKMLRFLTTHPKNTLWDRVTYFVGCRMYEVAIALYINSVEKDLNQ